MRATETNVAEFTSSNLPIVKLNTNGQNIQDEPKITATLGIIDRGEGQRNLLTDSCNHYFGTIGIEIRGSSSQETLKKSYGFETRNSLGEDEPVSLLGMPKESDWVLYAEYSDNSMLRNTLAYELGNRMGRWTPHTRHCELFLNGTYQGSMS